MLRYLYRNVLNAEQRDALKSTYFRYKRKLVETCYSFDAGRLKESLTSLGIRSGDSVLVQSSFHYFNGFRGTPNDVIRCLLEVIGESGNLLMVSMPYTCSSDEYLRKHKVFDVRKTPSKMGIISEVFRRKQGVLRSLCPTHPVLALGPDSKEITGGHEQCEYPCGKNSPFEKFLERDGKVLFIDAPFNNFTFIHYIEDDIRNALPFSLYNSEPLSSTVIDFDGRPVVTKVYTFSETAVRGRNPFRLEKQIRKRGQMRTVKVGNTKLALVRAADALRTARESLRQGIHFYDA